MKKAVINPETGEVENVIRAGDSFVIPGKTIITASDDCGPGWSYSNGQFHPPADEPAPVPEPSALEIRLTALETKLGVTQADRDAAKLALINRAKS